MRSAVGVDDRSGLWSALPAGHLEGVDDTTWTLLPVGIALALVIMVVGGLAVGLTGF